MNAPFDVDGPPVPADVMAEQAVLGALMLDPSRLALVADWLGAGDFLMEKHQAIYTAITELAGRGAACDAVTLGDWFDGNGLADLIGGIGYLIKLASETPGTANLIAYAEIVIEKSKLRQTLTIATDTARKAVQRGATAEHVVSDAQYQLAQLQSVGHRGGLEPARVALKQFFAELTKRYEGGEGLLGLPTPWVDVNTVLMGLQPATFYIVGGRPSMGKSVFGGQVATFTALRDHHTALFSVEMSKQQCVARGIAATGHIPYSWTLKPNPEHPDSELYWSQLTPAMTALNKAPLLIDDTPGLAIEQLMARARRAHMQRPLELIVVDHIHDMALNPKREVRHEIGRIAQGLKTLAKEMNIPVIAIAQLNRDSAKGNDKRPGMTALREAGELEQKADVILLLHREDYYNPATHLKGVVELIGAKGRDLDLSQSMFLQNRFDQQRLDDWDGPIPSAPAANFQVSGGGLRSSRSPRAGVFTE